MKIEPRRLVATVIDAVLIACGQQGRCVRVQAE
jgi:hypothetical protein